MKQITTICLALLATWSFSLAQNNVQEQVYLHLNNEDFIVGETIRFSAYVQSAQSNLLSDLSSILYVELVDPSGNPVLKGKIKIEKGVGNGGFFIHSKLPTDRYRLVAYTRWMQNFGSYFQQELTIINPYAAPVPTELEDEQLQMEVYPEGGQLLLNRSNNVLLYFSSLEGKNTDHKVKVISDNNEVKASTAIDSLGFAFLELKPLEGQNYRILVENRAGIQFFDLPKACTSCSNIAVEWSGTNMRLAVQHNDTDQLALGIAIKGKNYYKTYQVAGNTILDVRTEKWQQGLYEIVLKKDSLPLAKRLVWVDNDATSESQPFKKYKTNEKVVLQLGVSNASFLSVSVSKEQPFSRHEKITQQQLAQLDWANNYIRKHALKASMDQVNVYLWAAKSRNVGIQKAPITLYPEYRYGYVQGNLMEAGTQQPIAGAQLGIGFPGFEFEVNSSKTNEAGVFLLRYDPKHWIGKAYINVIDSVSKEWELYLHQEFNGAYPVIQAASIGLDSVAIQNMVQRSIYNQIENAYYEEEKEVVSMVQNNVLTGAKTYVLDDFTRFTSMRDTFIEIVYEVGVSKDENDYALNIKMDDLLYKDQNTSGALVLLDGVFVHGKDILTLSPYIVERISVLNKRYYIGHSAFDGIVSITTKREALAGKKPVGRAVEVESIQRTMQIIPGFLQDSKAPSFENQLYWANSQALKEKQEISFYTSKNKGVYLVSIEGIVAGDQLFSKTERIIVE